ncbi:MAG: PQQ-binding-like beta-propeller repeat protein [Acidobacteria bacterium]|nr:PQQ-binding-like beta-propeller repeat protein [Acidobacteriota bacterium]
MRTENQERGCPFSLAAAVIAALAVQLPPAPVAAQDATVKVQSPLPQLTAGGQTNWAMHNVDLRGSRYSEVDEINTSNAGSVELAWTFTAGAENSITQTTPLVIDGVMYVNAGGTLFALNATSGETIWTTTLGEALEARGRGPAYGDGKLYAFGGATMYAADARTGELVESFGAGGRLDIVAEALAFKYPDDYPPNVDAYSLGYRITTPAVYHDGTLYGGFALSENHIPGGLVVAADATTGEIKWVFNTVPQGPRDDGWEIAKDSWGDGQKVGGGIWTPPAIDAEMGLIYVNSGNPSPDYDGSARPGMNLFTNATIALHLDTGRLAWYYQAIHHDLWDFDHVTGPTLFDVTAPDGGMIKGVAAAGKNCLLYLWHRETGEPIHPMVETTVPTESDVPGEQAYPTQPIPHNARGVPLTPFCATFPILSDPEAAQRARQLYTPYSVEEFYILAHGGSSWGPLSFSPRTGLLYVTGKDGGITFTVNPVGDTLVTGESDGHSDNIAEGPIRDDMTPEFTISAYDPATGDLVWQQRAPTASAIGASGNLVTAGDLVIQGTDVGGVFAYDARTGEVRFSYRHNRAIRSSPMTYAVNGKQYIAMVASNDVLAFALP